MQKRELEQILQTVASAFPDSGAELLDSRQTPLLSRSARFPEDEETICLTCTLSDGEQLHLYLPAGAHPDPAAAQYMLDVLIAMLSRDRNRRTAAAAAPVYPLLNNLLYADTMERKLYTSLLAEEQGKDMTLPRVVCVLSVGEVPLEEIVSAVTCFRETDPQDICGAMGEHQVILCRCLRESERSVRSQCDGYLRALAELLNTRYGLETQIWVGTPADKVEDYRCSWEMALAVGRYSGLWAAAGSVHYIGDYLVEYVLEHTDAAQCKHFLEPYAKLLRGNTTLLETARALLCHDLNLSRAAQARFVHRNTMNLHCRQLRETLGLDPMYRDSDCYLLMLICAYCNLG